MNRITFMYQLLLVFSSPYHMILTPLLILYYTYSCIFILFFITIRHFIFIIRFWYMGQTGLMKKYGYQSNSLLDKLFTSNSETTNLLLLISLVSSLGLYSGGWLNGCVRLLSGVRQEVRVELDFTLLWAICWFCMSLARL